MEREIPILFKDKSECCACGACLNVCPKNAITMQEDEYGFLYPHIKEDFCVGCGKCKTACAYQNTDIKNKPVKTYAAVARDREMVMRSASAGIFSALAKSVINNGGIAVGAEFQKDFSVKHLVIDKVEDILKLQGSKYTQSDTVRSFTKVKKHLMNGRQVLFSGTPCQVDGLKGFLGKDYKNLLTVDIICHGVPNNQMLKDYLRVVEKKNAGKMTAFSFRDKSLGWGINGSAQINGKKIKIWQSASSYLYYFMQGWIYRENCYRCKYACSNRPADITIGDYWGIEKQHPDYIGKKGWDESKGISVVIVNTEKGLKFLKSIGYAIEMKDSLFEKAAFGNAQLKKPSSPGNRKEIIELYKTGGWTILDERFHKKIGWRYYKSQLKSLIPVKLKSRIKSII